MGTADIINAKHEGDRSFREVAGDAFFAVLLMASNFKDRMMKPLGEGVPVPRLRRTGEFAGQVVNKVDVALGDKHTVIAANNIVSQVLAGIGAIADGETTRLVIVDRAEEVSPPTAVIAGADPGILQQLGRAIGVPR